MELERERRRGCRAAACAGAGSSDRSPGRSVHRRTAAGLGCGLGRTAAEGSAAAAPDARHRLEVAGRAPRRLLAIGRAAARAARGGLPAERCTEPERAPSFPGAARARQPADPGLEGGAARGARSPRPAICGAAGSGPRSRPSPGRSPAPAATGPPSSACATEKRRDTEHPSAGPLRDLYAQEHRRGAGTGVQLARRAARGLRSLRPEPEARGLDHPAPLLRRRRLLRRLDGPPRPAPAARRCAGRQDRCRGRLQGRSADPRAGRLRPDRRHLRRRRGLLRLGHPGLQYHLLDGQADAERAALLRAVRTRSHRRAGPRQDRRFQGEGHVDGWHGADRLSHRGAQPAAGAGGGRPGAADLRRAISHSARCAG